MRQDAASRRRRLGRLLNLGNWKPTKAGNRWIRYDGCLLVLWREQAGRRHWHVNVGGELGRDGFRNESRAIKWAFEQLDPPGQRDYGPRLKSVPVAYDLSGVKLPDAQTLEKLARRKG
jgi:hypothetical protein